MKGIEQPAFTSSALGLPGASEIAAQLAQLEGIYERVPRTTCRACGTCCSLWAKVFFIEFLNMRMHIDAFWPRNAAADLRVRVRRRYRGRAFYAGDAGTGVLRVTSRHCLLNDESTNMCTVYPVRPLECRLHGLSGECADVHVVDPRG